MYILEISQQLHVYCLHFIHLTLMKSHLFCLQIHLYKVIGLLTNLEFEQLDLS